jgi:outer membrane protein OmpA-like peptidoglycan-associated protein
MKPILFFFSFLFALIFNASAQVLKINCIEPKEVVLPSQEKSDEEIHYANHEGFSFWYRIRIEENGLLSYKVQDMGENNALEVSFYAYQGVNFCSQLVKEKIETRSASTTFSLKVKKGMYFYLGITDNGDQCGHQINFELKEKSSVVRSSLFGGPCMNKGIYEHPDEVQQEEVVDNTVIGGLVLQGKVGSFQTGQTIDADLHFTNTSTTATIDVFSYRLNGFSVDLEPKEKYTLHVEAMGYEPLDTIVQLTANKEMHLKMKPIEKGGKFIMDNIYFYPNTFAYKSESEEALNSLTSYLMQHKKIRIEIQGHTNGNKDVKRSKNTDKTGAAWNYEGTAKELSKRRADVLRDFLVAQGVSKKRIVTVGKGGDEMIVPDPKNMTEAARNIRVEIRILEN